jgi:diguanylate cyclase (GGDEF)-like protein
MSPLPLPLPRSLRQQASARVLAVLAALGLAAALLLTLAWHAAETYLHRSHVQESRETLTTKLDQLYRQWEINAAQLAATIAYTRMLEAPEDRWPRLRAYLNTLGDTYGYDTLLVVDKDRRVLFTLGHEGDEFAAIRGAMDAEGWFFSKDHAHLHRVLANPIWLGPASGRGHIVLLRILDNATLASLAGPGMRIHLIHQGRILASSEGNLRVNGRAPCDDGLTPAGALCWDEAINRTGLGLRIEETLPQVITPQQFILAGGLLFLTLALALHATLGRWMNRTVARVVALSEAAGRFDTQRQVDREVEARIDRAGGHYDEIGQLQVSLRALMHSSEEREAESAAYLQTLEMLEEAVVEIDTSGRLLRASPAFALITGQSDAAQSLHDHLEEDDQDTLRHLLDSLFHGDKTQVTARVRVRHPERPSTWIECRFVAVDQPATRARGVMRDITQTYLQERHIAHMALHDALTGLPNRILLEDRIKIALRMAARDQRRVGIGFVDLDHFKHVNDALGHKVGDQLLVAFAENLHARLRNGDTLARWGGDEFVVLLPDMPDAEAIRQVAAKLAQSSLTPIVLDNQSLPVSFSMGFAVYPDDGDSVDLLLSQADQAMFHAKSQGRNAAAFFGDMNRRGLNKQELYIQGRLAKALKERRLTTWFQPLVEAGSHRLVGLEALARWQDDELGWVSPATFIPMVENMGLVHELGQQVIAQTLALGGRLRGLGHDLKLNINISKRQLYMHNFIDSLLVKARQAGIPAGQVVLEVTESVALGEVEFAQDRLQALNEAGFRIAIDDFGVGYSSLSLLHEMPVDEIKIDISFTRRVGEPQGARVIQAIVGMSEALGLRIVAEGVEDADTAAILNGMGVHCLQGYHFARPMPEGELMEWLAGYAAAGGAD